MSGSIRRFRRPASTDICVWRAIIYGVIQQSSVKWWMGRPEQRCTSISLVLHIPTTRPQRRLHCVPMHKLESVVTFYGCQIKTFLYLMHRLFRVKWKSLNVY